MSEFLIASIMALCPGFDTDHKGQAITDACQEWMINCVINEAGTNEATQKNFDNCASKHRAKIGSGAKIVPSDISED